MKIGIFDSGLGGLFITKSIVKMLPQYEYLYVGDTERTPYGNRSEKIVYQFLAEAVDFLFRNDCALVIVACNTASAQALRRVQQEYIPAHYPTRRVLGVIIPAVEEAIAHGAKKVGVLATASTVRARAFTRELKKRNTRIMVYERPAPLLVPIIEHDELEYADEMLKKYLAPLIAKKIDTLILGCTHYPILKQRIKKMVGPRIRVISQDEIVGTKLKEYLLRHKELARLLSRRRVVHICVTDITPTFRVCARRWFGKRAPLKTISLTTNTFDNGSVA